MGSNFVTIHMKTSTFLTVVLYTARKCLARFFLGKEFHHLV